MKDYKCISIENDTKINENIFDSIEIGEKFYIETNNKEGLGLYKYLCVKTENKYERESFIHKSTIISCFNICCYMCRQFKCLGGKPIKVK